MAIDLVHLSRTVSLALRHEPWRYELELDEHGWTDVDALIVALRESSPAFANVSERDLADMIEAMSKRRHEMIGGRIRALYGHSLSNKLRKEPHAPPDILFHGTAPAFWPAIERKGLSPMARQYVHLSIDRDDAVAVASRNRANRSS